MRAINLGVSSVASATLVLELILTRVFDVVLTTNMSYAVVTMAVFAFGLAGIFAALRPLDPVRNIRPRISRVCVAFAIATVMLIPLINALPLDYQMVKQFPLRTVLSFVALYLALIAPFFLGGYVLILVFSSFASRMQRLYFWDLVGAGIGSLLVIPLIAKIGPSGLMLCAAALSLIAAALFSESHASRIMCVLTATIVVAVPFIKSPDYIDFTLHMDKRGVKTALEQGRGEFVRWDPISRIDVIDETWSRALKNPWHGSGDRKAIQYDGGNQTSYFYKFNGDLQGLRAQLDDDTSRVDEQFWFIGVLTAHYLKRDTGQSVLIMGSAGGQETKAALAYGASRVDAVELVESVIELGTGRYAPYIGDFFHNPAVHVQAGEGRSYLRHCGRRYDIIQIFSNHTSSSAATGTGVIEPVYLQTAEAYEEYFTHLTDDGVLQVNHVVYPRMITTAALAWKRMGRTDFARHVAVYYSPLQLTLPTLLIKMKPWNAAEIASLTSFLAPTSIPASDRIQLVEDPLDPNKSFLSGDFYSGDFPRSLAARMPYDATPRTDNHPYFRFIRTRRDFIMPDPKDFVDAGTAETYNTPRLTGVEMDLIHLYITGAASIAFVLLFVLVPLRFSAVGRQEGTAALPLLTYFSCLGAGFIMIELVLIQKFMNLIGSPLYTYSTVIFAMLLAAGIGSTASEKFGISPHRRWAVPFVGVLVTGSALVLSYAWLAQLFLSLTQFERIAASISMIFPLGFFLGMPFPIGVLAIAGRPRGAIAWAWGMNGLFTVVGGLLSVLISVFYGFNMAIVIALALYLLALATFRPLRDAGRKLTPG